jgi:hypothetical protein
MFYTIIVPLNRRGLALFFFLIKRTKNQVSKEASLRSGPLPGSSGKTSGCKIFAPLRPLSPCASAKNCYAPPSAQAHQFYLPSPEAFLLTVFGTEPTFTCFEKCKRSAKACQGARPGVWPV